MLDSSPATRLDLAIAATASMAVGLAANWWLMRCEIVDAFHNHSQNAPSVVATGGNSEVTIAEPESDQIRDRLVERVSELQKARGIVVKCVH